MYFSSFKIKRLACLVTVTADYWKGVASGFFVFDSSKKSKTKIKCCLLERKKRELGGEM